MKISKISNYALYYIISLRVYLDDTKRSYNRHALCKTFYTVRVDLCSVSVQLTWRWQLLAGADPISSTRKSQYSRYPNSIYCNNNNNSETFLLSVVPSATINIIILCETHSRKRRRLYRNTSADTTHTHTNTHLRICVTYFCSIIHYMYITVVHEVYIYVRVCLLCSSERKVVFQGVIFAGRQSVAQTSSAPPSRCQSQTRATMLSLQCLERPQCCFSIIVTYIHVAYKWTTA